jgi:Uncharacterised protein family (UPF0149)
MSYLPAFHMLVKVCAPFPGTLPPVTLNGYLSGIAAGPVPLEDLPWTEALVAKGELTPVVEEAARKCLEAMQDDLEGQSFDPFMQGPRDRSPRVGAWVKGFTLAIQLDEELWRDYHDASMEAAETSLFVQSFASPDLAGQIGIRPAEHRRMAKDAGGYLGPALERLYGAFRTVTDAQLATDGPAAEAPAWTAEELAGMSDEQLIGLLTMHEDLLPRSVLDTCVGRGARLVPRLAALLDDDSLWQDEVEGEGRWWALVHALFIMGAMHGPEAAKALTAALPLLARYPDSEVWDQTLDHWPALFRNKQDHATGDLERIAADPALDRYTRGAAFDCLLDDAHRRGPAALAPLLARIATIAEDPGLDSDLRCWLGGRLLDYPRTEHRPLLMRLAEEQSRAGFALFDADTVTEAYAAGVDRPDRGEDSAPLDFYTD